MFCINCGQETTETTKFCINCGEPFKQAPEPTPIHQAPTATATPSGFFQKINTSNVIKVLIGLVIVGFIIYSNIDDQVVKTNNDALNSFNTGNSTDAISQLESASQGALTNENKVNTLKNLAYVYSTEGKNDKALTTFKEALTHTKVDSFDYFLILGEVADLEGKPLLAKQHYERAYSMNSSDFQINNALALFYMDVEQLHPQYADVIKGLQFARVANSTNNTAMTLGNLGVALVLNEKYAEAITYLNQINLQQHPYINLWLGLAYAGLENVEKAKYHLQQYIATGEEVPPEITDYLKNN
jgi:Tfp pilus assembly protein PilF